MRKIYAANFRNYRFLAFLLSILSILATSSDILAQNPRIFNASGSFTVPAGVTSITVEAWGGGGGGNSAGGGGGGYASKIVTVSPGSTFAVTVGTGGSAANDGGNSSFATEVVAGGGKGSDGGNSPGVGGAGITGTTKYSGGNGGKYYYQRSGWSGYYSGGGGGGSALDNGNGNDGANASNGNTGGVGGTGTGNGGNGASRGTGTNATDGSVPGGGGGGRSSSSSQGSADGANGRVVVSWDPCSAPSIATQPAAQTICTGGNVTFSVTAGGTAPLSYQWKKGGTDISGATNSSYSITGVTGSDAANYSVYITNTCGNTTSNNAALTISTPVSISTDPADQTKCVGQTATFSVSATGGPLTYQWQKNNVNISGATSANYTTPTLAVGDNNTNYRVIVTAAGCGSVISASANLTVNSIGITTQPAAQTICTGNPVTFSVTLSGTTPYTYQWKKAGANITGATNSTLTISNVTVGDAGNYSVAITNICGIITSNNALLTVGTTPAINTDPVSQIKCTGQSVTFSVSASGNPLTYQWRKNGSNISGATASSLTINTLAAADAADYDVVVTAASCGSVTSQKATLTVNTPVSISTQPASQTICSGGPVTFSVTATGTAPVTYQWRKGGTAISGETNVTYSIASVNTGDAATYSVVITNDCGAVTSGNAVLTVDIPPSISLQPVSQTFCTGQTVTFKVTAAGTSPGYQWRKNGVNISGANSATYTKSSLATGDAGNYDVVVSVTNCSSVTSDVAMLTVNTPAAITTQPVSQTICLGTSATFSVAASGTPAPTFQWKKNGANISGVTSATYTIPSVSAADAATYTVVVTNTCSSVTSSSAVLTTTTEGSWLGVTSTDWFVASNWGCGVVPTSTTDVTIPVTAPNMPNINGTGAVSRDITINGTLTITGSNNLDVYGDWANNATFTGNSSSVNFRGGSNNTIGGSKATTFGSLVVNKNATANTLTSITKAFTASNLTVSQGNLILQATDADYTVSNNITVPANGILTHSVNWDTYGRLLSVGGNIAVDGIFNYTVRSHVQMTGSAKTVYTGTNPASAFSILTLTATGNIAAAGTLTVNDNFWAMFGSTGSFTTGTNTVTANAGLLNSGGTVIVNGGTLNVTGGISVSAGNAGALTFSSGTINTDGLTVGAATTGTFTHSGGTLNVNGNLTITTNGTYTASNSPIINITGNWSNNKTFTAGSSQVNFNGSTVQTIGGSSQTTFNNLSIANASGVTLSTSSTVNNTLDLTNGLVTTGANVMTVGVSGNITNASATRYINGKLAWIFSSNTSRTYPVGKSGNYRPVSFQYLSRSGTSTVTVEQIEGNIGTPTANATAFTQRYWNITQSGGTSLNYKVTLSDPGFTPVGPFVKILKKEGSGAVNPFDASTPNYTNVTGFTTFNGGNNGTNSFALAHDCSSSADAGAPVADFCQGGSTPVLGGTISGTATGGTWSSSAGGTFTPGATDLNATWTPPANYHGTATLTLTPTGGLCAPNTAATKTVKVIQGPSGTFSATETSGVANNDNIICAGSTIKFTAPAGFGYYNFYRVGTTDTLQKGISNVLSSSSLVNGDQISVLVANSNNCAITLGPIVITVNDLPISTLTSDKTSICTGESVTFTAGGGTNYIFKVNGTSVQSGTTATYTSTSLTNGASVTVDVTGGQSCTATSDPVVMIVNTLPAGTLTTTETSGNAANDKKVCVGDVVIFTATAGAGNTYNFKFNNVSVYSGSLNTFDTAFTAAGNPVVTVDVSNASGCSATFGPAQVITVSAVPSGSLTATENSGAINNNEVCSGSSVTFTATAGTGNNYKFYLNGAGASLQSGTSNTYSTSTLADGDYLTVTVTNSSGCASVYTSTAITVVAAPAGTLSAPTNPTNTICFGGDIDFTATTGFTNYNFKVNGTSFQNGPSNTANHSGFAEGDIVTVEVSNAASCSAIFNSLTIHVNPLPTGDLKVGETSGNTNNDGIICTGADVVFTATAGFANYNFKLNGTTIQYSSSNIYSNNNLANGSVVSVEVSSAAGCAATFNDFTITVHPYDVVAAITGNSEVCVGNNITLSDVTPSGTWSSAQPTIATVDNAGVVTGVSAGIATISYTLVNANGCETIVTKDIAVNALPIVAVITGPSSVCVGSNIALANVTTGGVWSSADDGIATVDASGVVTGVSNGTVDISYTVTNSNGCITVVTKNITVNLLPVVPAITGTTSVCVSSTTTLANTTSGGVWSSGDAGIATVNASTGVVTGVSDGTVTISYKVTNGATGCSTTVTTDVTVNALPEPTLDGPNPICLGSIGNVYTTEAGQFNYSWNVTNGTVTSGGTSSDNTITISWLTPGNKSISVNYEDANGCAGATFATVVNAPGSSPTITGPASACQNSTGNTYSTETGKIDYTWTINGGTITAGDGTESVTVTWDVAGAKSITVNYAEIGGCSAATPTVKNVTVNPLPTVVIHTPAAVCSPATVNLTAAAVTAGSTSGLTYTYWTDAAATVSYTTPTAAVAGTYYIKGTTASGCYDVQSVIVTVNPTPSVTVTDPGAVCSPATVDITDAAVTNGSTAGLTFTYWTNSGASSSYATPTTAGAGTYYIKGATPEGCYEIKPVVVTVNPKPTVVIHNPAALCSPATADLTVPAVTAGSTSGLTYTYWSDAAATVAYTTPATADAGTYYIKGTTTAGCEDIQPVTVTVNPTPSVVITNPAAVCSPATVNLTAAGITTGSTAGLTYTYWTDAAAIVSYATPNTAGAGTYYIKGTTASGCYDIQPVTVTVNPTPSVVVTNPAAVCSPATVNLTLPEVTTGSTSGLTYTYWTNAAATTSYATPATAGGGTYYIKGETAAGCYDIKAVIVTVNPIPTLVINNPAAVCAPATVNLTAGAVTAGSSSGLTYTYWTNSTATVSYSTPATAGAGTYYIKATSAAGCYDIKAVTVIVNDPPAPFLIDPTSAAICLGDIVSFSASANSSSTASQTFSSGNVNLNIPDDNANGAVSAINISGIPADAIINSISVKFNVPHEYDQDLVLNLKAPNGNRLNLVDTRGTGPNFTNTTISSTSNNPLTNSGQPYSGTYRADATNGIGANGNVSNVNNFNSLYSSPNGNWSFSARDVVGCHGGFWTCLFGNGDYYTGTLNNWSITINYTVPNSPLNVTWTPVTDLYTDPGATTAYTGTGASTVYAKPAISGSRTYTATATNAAGCSTSQSVSITVNPTPVVTITPNYCLIPGKVRLTASSVPAASSYLWSTGETTASIDVDIAGSFDVTVFSGSGCPGTAFIDVANELVINGDFEGGDGGFTTLYGSRTGSFYTGSNTSGLWPDGKYAVDKSAWSPNNGVGYHTNFHGRDHTTGTGKFMMVNGSQSLVTIWEQTVQVLPNTTYYFSAWGMNLNPTSPARLRFAVNTTQAGSTLDLNAPGIDKPTNEASVNIGNWKRFYGTWTSGPTTTSAAISILNLNTDPGGNDFGLDDISFATLSTFIDLISAPGTDAQSICVNTALTDIVYRAGNGDPAGPNVSGLPDGVSYTFVGDKVTISGTPTAPGDYTYTITTTGCAPYSVTGTITVQSQTLTLSAGTSSPAVCINAPLPTIEYTIGGSATEASLTSGAWPAGISGTFNAGKFTITGTPSIAGIYPYTITTAGNCTLATISGTITVQQQEIELTSGSATQEVCLNQDISPIVYTIGGTGTGAGVTGLPDGVTGFYSGGAFIITGSPTAPAAGVYNYTVTTTGTCAPGAVLTGSITVNPDATVTLSSGAGTDGQALCINSAMTTPITYTIGGGGTDATVTGLPDGVTGSYSAGVLTIDGTPSVTGTFTYTITTTGTCAQVIKTGTITVNTQTITLTSGSASPTLCLGSTLTDIVFTTGGTATGAVLSGTLPNGVTGSFSGNTFTISGSPTELGSFTYTVTTAGSCATASVSGTVVVNTGSIGGTLPDTVRGCSGITGTLNLTGSTGNVSRWESSTDYGINWNNISNTTTTLPYVNVTVPTQYRALVKSGSCNAVYSTVALVSIHNYWTGSVSADWSDPSNWSDNQLPSTSCPDAYIPAGTPNQPVLGSGTGTVKNLHIYSGATLTINGTGALQIGGSISNAGIFDASKGSIEMNGTALQTIPANAFDMNKVNDLIISNTAGVSLAGNMDVYNSVTYGANNGALNTNGNLTLKSTIDNTAWIGNMTNHIINGDVTVERYINVGTGVAYHGKSWQFLATPTQGQTVKESWMEGGNTNSTGYGTQITGPGAGMDASLKLPSMKYYNYQSDNWVGISSTANPVYDQKGYMLFVRGDRSVAFPNVGNTTLRTKGALITPNNPPPSTAVTDGRSESVGNPYAAAIDMTKIGRTGGVAEFFTVWDPKLSGDYGLGAFQTFNKGGDGNYYATPGGGSYGYDPINGSDPNNFIQSGQAFFVQATGQDGTVTFDEGVKAGAGSYKNVLRGSSVGDASGVLQLRASLFGVKADARTFLTDGNLIQFNESYSNKIDRMDARKLVNSAENLGIKSGGKDLSIERRHGIVESDTIFYNLTGVIAQNYQLEFIASGLTAYGMQGYVEDTYLSTLTPLTMDGVTKVNFAVTSAAGSKAANRFRIVFRQAPVIALPVTFISVKAYQKESDVAVEWKVENEKDMQQYEVEKSSDGVRFSKSGALNAINNGTQSYQWIDGHVAPGTNYYRIRSIGQDGKVNYSTIVKVAVAFAKPSIAIYPNPITDGIIHLQLVNQPGGMYGMKLLNSLGQVIVSKQVGHAGGNATENIKWDYNLAHGVYHLEVIKPGGEVVVIKVMY